MAQAPHLVHKGGTNPKVNITTAFLGKNYSETIYGLGNFEFGPNFEKKDLNRGFVANFYQLSFNEVVKCKFKPHH